MRKSFLLLVVSILVFPLDMAAKTKTAKDSLATDTKALGIHPYKETKNIADGFTHWSLGFEAGFNLIDGDFVQPNITIIPKTKVRPTGGISLEYSFTPTWGLMGVYNYANYGVKQKGSDDYLLYGHMHSLELLLSYDLVDAWFPHRKTDIFSCYLLAGLGMGFYNSELALPEQTLTPRADGKYDMVGIITAGLAAEFNVSREIALGVKGLYHIYTNDKIDGKIQGTSNDCMEYCSAYLRWKIGGRKKNHTRNYASDELLLAKQQCGQQQRQAQKDTVVLSQKDTVMMIQQMTTMQQTALAVPDKRYYVYFAHGKSELDETALISIQQLAALLKDNDSLCVELSGYCDNTGSEKYNETLAQKRADNVRQELMRVYGIADSRILATGKGMITNVGTAYGPNRRVEMRLVSMQEIDSLRQTVKPVAVNKAAQEETKPAESYIATVKTQKNRTTLSKLARKYYNNTECWVYIYEANRDKLKNPDFIPEGITLRIPRLTTEQTDAGNAESMKKARILAAKYLRK